MHEWSIELRASVSAFFDGARTEAESLFAAARAMIAAPKTADMGALVRAHMAGVGSYTDVDFYRVRQLIDELAERVGYISASQSFFDHQWILRRPVIDRFCPDLVDDILIPKNNDGLECTVLLEPCPNEAQDLTWPASISFYMKRPMRWPLHAYATNDAVAYVHPFRYQIMSRNLTAYWESGSPRCMSRRCLANCEEVAISGDIVMIQDRFDFRNLCHFVFDGLTRVAHYVSHFGYTNEVFVFGGVPVRYHELMCDALCETHKIPPESLLFPSKDLLLRGTGKCIWFSDQKEMHAHPAQMAHPTSLNIINSIAGRIRGTPSSVERLYISRGDARHRRIVNEPELIQNLEQRGFVALCLADLSAEDQIGLFQNARTVVGPHGMGLTHIFAGPRIERVIELFHPEAGTDAYAFVAKTACINYDLIMGEAVPATHADFLIDVDRVMTLLGPDETVAPKPNWNKAANLIPASRSFRGFTAIGQGQDTPSPETLCCRMLADHSVMTHKKIGPIENTFAGGWHDIPVTPATMYVASCWIWIPDNFDGQIWPATRLEVSIRTSDWKPEHFLFSDSGHTNRWQRITWTTISPRNVTRCSIDLHIQGNNDCIAFSTCWQLERGVTPTAYVATG
jgi:Glycosyltransferase 61